MERANLYLDEEARSFLEDKESSSLRTVRRIRRETCSSFEILSGLTLGDDLFMKHKKALTEEILKRLEKAASNEADLLIQTLEKTGEPLTLISDRISDRWINEFTYQILEHLDARPLPENINHPLYNAFFSYCPPTLADHYKELLLQRIPEHHKKAIIACLIGAQLVYHKGLFWFPSIIDVLPGLLKHHDVEI